MVAVGFAQHGVVAERFEAVVGVHDDGAAPSYDLYVDETPQLDGQVSYSLNDNMTFTLEGINLLDTPFKGYFESRTTPALNGLMPRDTRRYDTTYLIGLRWRN